jgi:hypothetical protein
MDKYLLKLSDLLRLILSTPVYIIALVLFVPYGIFRGLTTEDIINDYIEVFDNSLSKIYFYLFKKKDKCAHDKPEK